MVDYDNKKYPVLSRLTMTGYFLRQSGLCFLIFIIVSDFLNIFYAEITDKSDGGIIIIAFYQHDQFFYPVALHVGIKINTAVSVFDTHQFLMFRGNQLDKVLFHLCYFILLFGGNKL